MWGRALGDHQGRVTYVAAVWLFVGEGSERGQCHCLASGVLSRRKLTFDTRPDARYFIFSPYATGALPVLFWC